MAVPSVVVPCFNEEGNLPELLRRLKASLATYPAYEIVIVDDGSRDGSLAIIKESAKLDPAIKFVSLTRNFGHQAALKVGLAHSTGEVTISMDADLQHPPELIGAMMDAWRRGYRIVNMVRRADAAPFLKRLTSKLFYWLANSISEHSITPGSSDFRLLDRAVVDVIRQLPEKNAFLRGLIPWLGFEQIDLTYVVEPRHAGKRKYGVAKMFGLALAGVTTSSIKPLRLSFVLGMVTSAVALVYAVYALIIKLVVGTAISGWTSLLISVLLLGGVQLIMLGVIGEYIGRIFLAVNGRPSSIVKESSFDYPGFLHNDSVANDSARAIGVSTKGFSRLQRNRTTD